MGEGWTRLPGGGWMRDMGEGLVLAAEAVPGGYEPQCWQGREALFRGPVRADAAHAAGIAHGWLLGREAQGKEGGAG